MSAAKLEQLEKERRQLEQREKKQEQERALEEMFTKKMMTFGDLESLNVDQINQVSHKYGEATFNPHDIFDASEDSEDEILKKFSSNLPKISNKLAVGSKKYSKPSNYSGISSSHMVSDRLLAD